MGHSPVVFGAIRVAIEDVEIGGIIIPTAHQSSPNPAPPTAIPPPATTPTASISPATTRQRC
jgi:hypothetical protein